MLYFTCHTELVRLTEHLRGTRKPEEEQSKCNTKMLSGKLFPLCAIRQCNVQPMHNGCPWDHQQNVLGILHCFRGFTKDNE